MQNEPIQFDIDDELDAGITPTPLSDPVFTAIFQNAEVSGLAMKSLLNSTLQDSGDTTVGEVISVTPQSIHADTSMRGYRIDVEAKTTAGEIALVEVQIKPFASTVERALLYAEQSLASYAKRGDALSEVMSAIPRVIVVNILEWALRKGGGFHQVVELSYREPPYERATDKLEIHNLELSKYRDLKPDMPAKPLHCWLTAICRAQDSKKPLSEVVKMDAQLKAFCDLDAGFAQFVERHGFVSATADVRKAYRRWEYDILLDKLEEERKAAAQAAELEASMNKAKAEGKAERDMEIACKAFEKLGKGTSESDIITELKEFGISDSVIKAALKDAKSKLSGTK